MPDDAGIDERVYVYVYKYMHECIENATYTCLTWEKVIFYRVG